MIYDLPSGPMFRPFFREEIGEWGRSCWRFIRTREIGGRPFGRSSLNPDFFVYRTRDLDEIFPWDFIDHGISKETLKKEYLKAMEEAETTQ